MDKNDARTTENAETKSEKGGKMHPVSFRFSEEQMALLDAATALCSGRKEAVLMGLEILVAQSDLPPAQVKNWIDALHAKANGKSG